MASLNLELTPDALLSTLSELHVLPRLSASDSKISSSPRKFLVAYSGGLDSHVLLHLFSQIVSDGINLRAVYVNHGLQTDANQWAIHCQTICAALKVPYASLNLHLSIAKGESIEEVARNSRYQALADELNDDEILVTAHHQNDQAETLLLQLFRGAGVSGLASMPLQNTFNSDKHIHFRPLLGYSRVAIEAYAKSHNLQYIEDPSNKDTSFDRNYLRQLIMPQLRERWLGIDKTISRAAFIQAETKSLLDELAAEKLPEVLTTDAYYAENKNTRSLPPLDISKLSQLNANKQRLIIRYWISQQGFMHPSDTKLAHIFSDVINAADDKQPMIEWSGVELRRYQKQLYIMAPLSEHDAKRIIPWNPNEAYIIDSLSLKVEQSCLDTALNTINEKVTIRFRQGGETIEMPKRGNISLKNLFQELRVPPWIRSRLPLIYIGEKLVKIVGLNDHKSHPPTF